jgi:hypothetical protein
MKLFKITILSLLVGLTTGISSFAQERRFESNVEGGTFIGFDADCSVEATYSMPSINYIAGVRLNPSQYIGLGVGIKSNLLIGTFLPIYLNYKHLLKSTSKLSPMISASAGAEIDIVEAKVNPYLGVGYGYSYSLAPRNSFYTLLGLDFTMLWGCPIIGPSFKVGFSF